MTMPTLPQWVVCPSTGAAVRLSAITAFSECRRDPAPSTSVWVGSNNEPWVLDVTPQELAVLIQADDMVRGGR